MRRGSSSVLATVLSLLAVCVMAAPASAAVLPEFTVSTKLVATFGASKLNTAGAEITSTEGSTTASETVSKQAGKFTVWFKNASLGGKECHSEGDTEHNILVPVEYHTVHGVGGTKYLLLLLMTSGTQISCKFLATKVVVESGSTLLGTIGPNHTKTRSFAMAVDAPMGLQQVREYENDAGGSVATELKLKVDGVSAKGSEGSETISVETEQDTELIGGGEEEEAIVGEFGGGEGGGGPKDVVTRDKNELKFGLVNVGAESAEGVVTYTANAAVKFGSIKKFYPEFKAVKDTCSNQKLAPKGTCKVGIKFKPLATSKETDFLSFDYEIEATKEVLETALVTLEGTGN